MISISVGGDHRTQAAVRAAMVAVDRALFLPDAQVPHAHRDVPLAIGHSATCSQPSTVADLLVLLGVRPGDAVLDVGSGSGWTTALLAHLAGPTGRVVGVELEPALVESGLAHLRGAGLTPAGDDGPRGLPGEVRLELADPDRLGRPDDAPFDRVLVSAEGARVPPALVAQLTAHGRMVLPVRGTLVVVDRDGDRTTQREVGAYRFVPLRGADL